MLSSFSFRLINMITINGIDLGAKGCICTLKITDDYEIHSIEFYPLSGDWNPYDKNEKERLKAHKAITEMDSVIKNLEGHTFIEDVKPYRGMSAKTMHGFSSNIAMIYSLMSLHFKPFVSIHAIQWQSLLDLKTKSKDKDLHKKEIADKITSIYPSATELVYTPRGRLLDGYTDALGIAHAGLQLIKGQ